MPVANPFSQIIDEIVADHYIFRCERLLAGAPLVGFSGERYPICLGRRLVLSIKFGGSPAEMISIHSTVVRTVQIDIDTEDITNGIGLDQSIRGKIHDNPFSPAIVNAVIADENIF